MKYGYNDTAIGGIGVVHLFTRTGWEARIPLCGKEQHYLPASESETPHCKTCERVATQHVYVYITNSGDN